MEHGIGSDWLRSSLCGAGNCVEVASLGDGVAVRDSKGGTDLLVFTADEWRAFVGGVKIGEFDLGFA